MDLKILHQIKHDLGLKSHSTIYKWVTGRIPITASIGKKLESLTGIDRRRFCWPDEFGPPWSEVELIYNQKIIPNKNIRNGKQK